MKVNITKRELWLAAVLLTAAAAIMYAQYRWLTASDALSQRLGQEGRLVLGKPSPAEPGFDVIRVTREGRAVLAGRALPGAEVTVTVGGKLIGKTIADKLGDWVMAPDQALAPGAQVLSLMAKLGEGGPLASTDSAIISIPKRDDEDVFVAVSRLGEPTRIMEQGLEAPKPAVAASEGVLVAGVDIDPSGQAILSGRAMPDQMIRLYLDDQLIGETITNAEGLWRFHYTKEVPIGRRRLRADRIGAADQVTFRAEAAFTRSAEGELTLGEQQIIVQQGNRLWEIARNVYGEGIAYSIIFTGNQEQIRDPNRIYPGQVFRLPAKSESAKPMRAPPEGEIK